jgi:hypothetical protein
LSSAGEGDKGAPIVLFADFAKKIKIELPNLSAEQVEEKLREAVLHGDRMPRAYYQSKAPLLQPTIIE